MYGFCGKSTAHCGEGCQSGPCAQAPISPAPKAAPAPKNANPGFFRTVGQSGVPAMHAALMPNGRVVFLDKVEDYTQVKLLNGHYAYSAEYDPISNTYTPLAYRTNAFCSGGSFLPNGTLLNVGGNAPLTWLDDTVGDDFKGLRYLTRSSTDASINGDDWSEPGNELDTARWYASCQSMPDGLMFVASGSLNGLDPTVLTNNNPTFEILNAEGVTSGQSITMELLVKVQPYYMYPFIHLLPDGTLFVFASKSSEILDVVGQKTVKSLPDLPGDYRTYPNTGGSVMLPLTADNNWAPEVIICGGGAYQDITSPTDPSCGRINPLAPNSEWEMDAMPEDRGMVEGTLLPDGTVLWVNGAQKGAEGFNLAADPALEVLVYDPAAPLGKRWTTGASSTIPRLYHSIALLLLDGTLMIAGSNPDQMPVVVPNVDPQGYHTEFGHFFHSGVMERIDAGNATGHQPTIALLGSGHTYQYFATQLALLHLGFRVLLLSPSNADVARDHLLTTCDAVGIVVQADLNADQQGVDLPMFTMLALPTSSRTTPMHDIEGFRSSDPWSSHSLIIHSSGTTGIPKPILHTHRSMMLIARMYRLMPEYAINNWYLLFPLFHIAGVSIALSGLPTGLILTFPPTNWPPAPSAILNSWHELETMGRPAECTHTAPAVIEDLYEYIVHTGGDFSPLTKLKVLQPGGAALSPLLLKKLVAVGCNVKTTYGSTEIGPPLRTIPHTRGNVHCYRVRNLYPKSPYLEMQAQGEGLFELLVYKGFPLAAELWPTEDSPNPYRTNDLFLEQPPGSGLFVLQGRKDDLLVHSNGEKTNALALQMALDSCPSISKSAVVGTGRAATAAIVEIVDNANEEETLDTIEQICCGFPTHSRLSRSLVYILTKGRTLPVTPKGSVRRKEVEKLYGAEIKEMYRKLEYGDQAVSSDPDEIDLSDQAFVLQCVQRVLGRDDIDQNANFYRLGLDSQKALRLRSALMKRFGRFPIHLVFESPTVLQLVQSLTAAPSAGAKASGRLDRQGWMRDTIAKYSSQITKLPRAWNPQQIESSGDEVVYLTGATGALGNALIEAFVANPKIQKVYCAARGGQQRLVKELTDRGYPNTLAQSSKLKAVPYVMSDPHLGLDADTYMEMAADTTIVVHGAWKLNFNMPVSEFEHDCVVGTMHLLRFATMVRQKTFSFCSSVATHLGAGAAGQMVPEDEAPDNMTLALDTGYAQSKLITERILQVYARHTRLPAKVFRIGQLVGHSTYGAWNSSEMFPIMLVTGLKYLKAMPLLEGELVDWLPVDICAQSIVSLLTQTKDSPLASDDAKSEVYNLVNPNEIPWTQFLDILEEASGVHFTRVSMAEWVSKLQSASSCDDQIPGAKLIGFFEDMAKESMAARPEFSTLRTAQEVPVLAATSEMNVTLLRVYLERWRSQDFL
ncbi:hypothetical protein LTS10_008330 [Elasticomyces elasticus]|nr:hypothetical protein LTS10_008330 [Elasticomyces elasticus]